MEMWERAAVAGGVIVVTLVVAKLADRAIARSLELRPETLTRYRVLRRSVVAAIVAVGLLSALLVIPPVRAVAGGVLASYAVLALVIGLAAQATLSNFVAGLLVAFTQPLRLGDRVEVAGAAGIVEEIELTYTLIRADDGARYFVPNTKLASDTIRNASLASLQHLAEITVHVPLTTDLERVREALEDEARKAPGAMPEKEPFATVSDLEATSAVVTVSAWAKSVGEAARLAGALRAAVHRRLLADGVYPA